MNIDNLSNNMIVKNSIFSKYDSTKKYLVNKFYNNFQLFGIYKVMNHEKIHPFFDISRHGKYDFIFIGEKDKLPIFLSFYLDKGKIHIGNILTKDSIHMLLHFSKLKLIGTTKNIKKEDIINSEFIFRDENEVNGNFIFVSNKLNFI